MHVLSASQLHVFAHHISVCAASICVCFLFTPVCALTLLTLVYLCCSVEAAAI